MWLLVFTPVQPSVAQTQPPVSVPGFWDPRRRPERPDTSRIAQIRFLTEFDYPPFNYAGPDGSPAGNLGLRFPQPVALLLRSRHG